MNPNNTLPDSNNIQPTVVQPTTDPVAVNINMPQTAQPLPTLSPQVMGPQVTVGTENHVQTSPIESHSQMMEEQSKEAPKRIAALFVVVIVVLAGVFGGLYALSNQTTKDVSSVSNQFIADLQANNPNKAYNLLSSAAQQTTSETQVAQTFSQLAPGAQGTVKITSKYIYKQTNKPEAANIVYLIGGSNGGYLGVSLQDNSSLWQIQSFQVSNSVLSAKTIQGANTSSQGFDGVFLVFGTLVIVLGTIGMFYPRLLWRLTKWQYMWQYRDNNLIDPSPVFLIFLRLLSIFAVCAAIFILFMFTQQNPIDTII